MAKIELDVTLLLVTTEVLAEAGDRLMVYNGSVIGVVPRNEKIPLDLKPSPASAKPPVFDENRLLQFLTENKDRPLTVRDINHRLGWTTYPAANTCSGWIRRQISLGFLKISPSSTSSRYPAVTL